MVPIPLTRSWCMALLLFAPALTLAQQGKSFGDYTVYYNALGTDQLTPAVAQAYGIQRSRSRALLNVSVRKSGDGSLGEPVKARIEATVVNLNAQLRRIDLREVAEQGAIYYIGDFPVADEETLRFSVSVQPETAGERYDFDFEQQFFTR